MRDNRSGGGNWLWLSRLFEPAEWGLPGVRSWRAHWKWNFQFTRMTRSAPDGSRLSRIMQQTGDGAQVRSESGVRGNGLGTVRRNGDIPQLRAHGPQSG